MRTLFLLLLLVPAIAMGQNARKVEVECRDLFSFDPISGRFSAGSLAQVAEYVDQWRSTDSIDLRISLRLSESYRIYGRLVDSTLTNRVLEFFAPFTLCDSVTNPIDFSRMPRSKRFDSAFDDDMKKIRHFFAKPIAELTTDSLSFSRYEPSSFSGLFHDFQLAVSGAEISFFAPSSAQSTLKKEVYISDILDIFKYDNDLVTFRITGREIKSFLEKAYSRRYYKLRDENSDLLRTRTPYYLHISAAGCSYEYNAVKCRIENLSLDLDREYSVVANSFIARNFNNLVALDNYKLLLLEWLMTQKIIAPSSQENWQLTPQRWVKVISEREIAYMLNNNL